MLASKTSILALAATGFRVASAIDLNVDDAASIRAAARTLAYGVQSYYTANASGPATSIGTFPSPSYWWMGGAIWGGMVDYWAYTDDSTWNEVTSQALVAQANAPAYDYMPPAFYSSLGNDDQTFWALSALSADEYGFPTPQGQPDTFWRDLGINVFNTQVPRWETSACGGGLRWQIFESNGRFTYKNSVSTGSLFQLAARLARTTGNQTYADWAVKTWDWMQGVGFISPTYQVFDGADMITNCSVVNRLQWTYNPALLIYGTTMMGAFTGDQVWKERTDGLLKEVESFFFSPFPNATNIMFEPACEKIGTCNYDQVSFKAYLSRWLAKAAVIDPSINSAVTTYIAASAKAAAQACTGGSNGQTCGQTWYTGGFDGASGPGQSLSALETVQALLLLSGDAARIQPNGDATVQSQPAPEPAPATSTYTPPPPSPPATMESATSVSSSRTTPSTSSATADVRTTASAPPPPPPATSSSIPPSTSSTPTPTPVAVETPTTTSTTSSISTTSVTSSNETTNDIITETSSTTKSSITVQSVVETPTEPAPEPTSSSTDAAPKATGMMNMAAAGVLVAGLAVLGA